MDVRCERCSTLYDFDEARIPLEGLSVKCSSCGHVFRVQRTVVPESAAGDWIVRQPTGKAVRFREMTTLQRWIVERKVSRDDEISHGGFAWKRLGDIPDLAPFFRAIEGTPVAPAPQTAAPTQAMPQPFGPQGGATFGAPSPYVAAAGGPTPAMPQPSAFALAGSPRGAQWEGSAQALPQVATGSWQFGVPPATPAAPAFVASHDAEGARSLLDDLEVRPRRRGKGKWVVLFLVLVLAGAAAGVYFLRPDLAALALHGSVNEIAVQEAASAEVELQKDSYAAIERARGMFAHAASLDAGYAAARAGLAQAELSRAEYLLEETRELEAKLAAAPADAQPALRSAIDERKREAQQRVESAFAAGSEAVKLAPRGVQGLRAMADYYRIMKAPDRMKPLLEQAHDEAPHDPWVAYVEGASVAGDPAMAERAIRRFDEALEAAPGFERARYAMARLFLAQGNQARAKLDAQAIVAAVPDHERARALLAAIEPPAPAPAAEAPAVQAKALAPKAEGGVEQLFARANRLRELDKPEQALELYRKAVELAPTDPDAHTGVGWCYLDMESYDQAVASFRRALQLAPRFSDAHFGIAEAYRAKGNASEAAKHYRAYLDITPDGEEAAIAKRQLEALQQ